MYKTSSFRQETMRFKHFSNRPYALFACMGKVVIVGTLSVATLQNAKANGISTRIELADTTAFASERITTLDGVDVTGSRAPLTNGQEARIVNVLERKEIAAAPVQSVNDLLKYVAGVDVRQKGPAGALTDVSVRGGTQEQITVLLNGINICDPQTGHNTFDFPVELSEIERIEVLEGAAGRVYGASSMMGAINIVTRKSSKTSLDARLEGGSYGYLSAGARGNWVSGHWNNQVSGSYTRSDGYLRNKAGRLNTDLEGEKALYQGWYSDKRVDVSWHAGVTTKGFGSNTFYSIKSDDQFEKTTKWMTAIQAETKGAKFHFRPSVYWNRNQDRFEFYRGNEESVKFNYHRTDVVGINLNNYFDWVLGRTAFGAEFRNEDIVSTTLGEPLNNPRDIHGTDRQYTVGLNRSNISFYLEHNVLLRNFTLSAGLVTVKNTWNEMPFKVYPGIDASYRIGANWKVYASFNTSLRMPSFTELYYSVGGHKADKYLKPEEMNSLEAGVKYALSGVTGAFSVYHHHGKNMIDWIMDTSAGEDAVWQSVNHTKLNANGIEASVNLDLLTLLPCQHFLQTLKVAYNYIYQDKELESNLISQYALEYLRHKVVAGLMLQPVGNLHVGINYRFQQRTGTYKDLDGVLQKYAPYSIFDARVSWDKPVYSVYVEANNIFDKTYVDYGNVPQPGTWVIAGVRLTL